MERSRGRRRGCGAAEESTSTFRRFGERGEGSNAVGGEPPRLHGDEDSESLFLTDYVVDRVPTVAEAELRLRRHAHSVLLVDYDLDDGKARRCSNARALEFFPGAPSWPQRSVLRPPQYGGSLGPGRGRLEVVPHDVFEHAS